MSYSELDIIKNLTKEDAITLFDPTCIRQKSNMSQNSKKYIFDSGDFEPELLLKDSKYYSPKLEKLLNKINELDKKDMEKYGKKFKHFIFSDLKSSAYGPKLISSALIANGFHLGYKSTYSNNTKKWSSIQMLSDSELEKHPNMNFYLLSSVSVYDKPISVKTKKEILAKFNQRPENIHGELARIIVMDSGFKEGIDLFDIKYIHIFEPSVNAADQKQVIGRGTRTCGQKGLDFHPNKGWSLHVFIYDLEFPTKYKSKLLNAETAFELYMKSINVDPTLMNFTSELEKASIYGSVDYELNENIHNFKIENGELENDEETIYGGKETISPKMSSTTKHEKMRAYINTHFGQYKWEPSKLENTCVTKTGGVGKPIDFNPTQNFIRHYFSPESSVKGMLLYHSTGTGKCHSINTPILMYDGTIKMVQDIVVGDLIMGDDSTQRKVLSLANGKDEMYDIIPTKGEKYTVNSVHILCLKPTPHGIRYIKSQTKNPYSVQYIDSNCKIKTKSFSNKEEAEEYEKNIYLKNPIIEIEVKDYLKLPKNIQRVLKGYRTAIEFPKKKIEVDPYLIGYWLGDGSKRGPVFSSQDSVILHYLRDFCSKNNLSLNYQSKYDYRISSNKIGTKNTLLESLNHYNLINNKHIPFEYKTNNRENRLSLLAGLIDSDGYCDQKGFCYEITQKNDILANDILFLCRSLGFAAYNKKCEKSCVYKNKKKTGQYNRIHISGKGLDEIPVKIERKKFIQVRSIKKNALVSGIKIESKGYDNYYGFTLDGNNRYVLGDFTVTHNTCSAIAAASRNFEPLDYTILWVTRTSLKNDIWKNMFSQICNENLLNRGNEIPEDPKKQMSLLSKSWNIRPLSYKQFSNLVSQENMFYKKLVKINGQEDPLRKTLLIIDEAHKLYGGGDLSSIERPDMVALHKSIMHSYAVSGKDSVRVLLMTATPITENPMELIQLMNLCKPLEEQLPASFESFKDHYLDTTGNFTEKGYTKYLDDITGHISYLNREKDARQFAQPIIKRVLVKITDEKDIQKFDKGFMKTELDNNILEMKIKTDEKIEELEKEINDIENTKDFSLKHLKIKIKEKYQTKLKNKTIKKGVQIVNKNIKELVGKIKDYEKEIKHHKLESKTKIKDLKREIKQVVLFKENEMKKIVMNIQKYPEEYEKYKKSPFSMIKSECGKTLKTNKEVLEELEEHPVIQKYNNDIQTQEKYIEQLKESVKIDNDAFKLRMKKLSELLNNDFNDLEKSTVKMIIKKEQIHYKEHKQNLTKKIHKELELNNENIQNLKREKKKKYQKVQKSLKNMLHQGVKKEKEKEKELKKLNKTMKKIKNIEKKDDNETQNQVIKELMNQQESLLDKDIENALTEQQSNKEEKIKLREEKMKKNEEKIKLREEKQKLLQLKRENREMERKMKMETKKMKTKKNVTKKV
jgi:hypothetical protein